MFSKRCKRDEFQSRKKDTDLLTLCDQREINYPKSTCLYRNCENYNVSKISAHYKDIVKHCAESRKQINWHKWEHITVQKAETKRITMSCVSKTTSVDQFLHYYEQDMISYPAHTFRASWQHEQISAYIKNLKEDQVIVMMDFAENYKCCFQNEVQSAYFDQNMVTIHLMIFITRNS